jgi:hypothetical protein
MLTIKQQRTRKASAGAPRPVLRKCFICLEMKISPDKEPPFRCNQCYEYVRANEADGEL